MPAPNQNAPEDFPPPRYIPVREAIERYLEARFGADAVSEFSDYLTKAWKGARRYYLIRGVAGTSGFLAAICVAFAIIDQHIELLGELPLGAVLVASFAAWLYYLKKRVQPALSPRLASLMDLVGSDELPLYLKPDIPSVGQSMQRLDRSYLEADRGVLLWSDEPSAYAYLRHRQKFSIAGEILVERLRLEKLVSGDQTIQEARPAFDDEAYAGDTNPRCNSTQDQPLRVEVAEEASGGANREHSDPAMERNLRIYRRSQELKREGLAKGAINYKLMDEFGCSKSTAEKIRTGKYSPLKNILPADEARVP